MRQNARLAALLLALLLALGGTGAWADGAGWLSNLGALLGNPGGAARDGAEAISEDTFPDAQFRSYVVEALDANGDGALSEGEREAVTEIDVSGRGIESLTGIRFFPNLQTLDLRDNAVAKLKLSSNPRLSEVDASGNRIRRLDLTKNKELLRLDVSDNQLERIDLSRCEKLTWLDVSGNRLRRLSLSKCARLRELRCGGNRLSRLNLAENGALEAVYAEDNRLRTIKLGELPALVRLECQDNRLRTVDASRCPRLSALLCHDNRVRNIRTSRLSPALAELAEDAALLRVLEDRAYWRGEDGRELSLPVESTLFDGRSILYGAENRSLKLRLSGERGDYADLTDAEYANFRAVRTAGMGQNALYRSSSPINGRIRRNTQAMEAMEAAGIRTVLNLADSEEDLATRAGYPGSYYSRQNVCAYRIRYSSIWRGDPEKWTKELRYMIDHEGPYLVHCTYGRDRTGFLCAVLECLMGAGAEEVVDDYMTTYYNFYGIGPGLPAYKSRVKKLRSRLADRFGLEAFTDDADLAAGAEFYLRSIGLSDGEIDRLRERLGADY